MLYQVWTLGLPGKRGVGGAVLHWADEEGGSICKSETWITIVTKGEHPE